ncbi:MAG TPA: glycosyl hydrolase family 8 [Ruminiclostridium sp.]
MNFSSLRKIEKVITVALVLMIVVSIVVITVWWMSLHNSSGEKQVNVESSAQGIKTVETDLAQKLDLLPDKYTLNQSLPDLTFVKENGDKLTLASMRGKIVVLEFWASWCPHCKKELEQASQLRSMLAEYSDVEYWLVDKLDTPKETKEQALSYLVENKIPFSTVFDEDLKAYKQLGIKIVPTTLIIDKQGVLRAWNAGEGLNAGALKAKLDYVKNGGCYGVRQFITRELTNDDGGVRTNYLKEEDTALKSTDVLSETQGLIMQYAVSIKDKKLFDNSFKYITNKMQKDPLTAWVVTEKGAARVNSALDDLRIYRALAKADTTWGGYSDKLDNYEKALLHYNTQNGNLVNEYDFKYRKKSNQLKLCFADFEALKLLANKSSQWEKVYQNSISIVEKGYISDKFPMYYAVYDYSKKTYKQDALNMAEGMVTLLHLASMNRLQPKTVDWLRTAVEGEGIFARYTTDGSVALGYRYESTAIYGLVSMIAKAIGDETLANKALARMEDMRVFDSENQVNGAFGNVDGTGIYSFDQCIALLTYSKFEESDAE